MLRTAVLFVVHRPCARTQECEARYYRHARAHGVVINERNIEARK